MKAYENKYFFYFIFPYIDQSKESEYISVVHSLIIGLVKET